MECCGNTIKDLYGFSCPLKCSTYILQSVISKNADYLCWHFSGATTNLGLKNKTTIWDPADGKTLVASLNKKSVEAPIKKDQTVGDYQFKSGNEKIVSLSNPNGMNVKAKALSANNKVNFFVRIWRWIFGGR